MRDIFVLFFAAALAICALGCTHDRTGVPVVTGYSAIRSAVQQEVVANSVDKAVDKLEFKGIEGSSVYCSLNGVFPHNDVELNDYIKTQVEYRLSRNGVLLITDPENFRKADYRCVISVAVSGAKVRSVRERLSGGRVAANIFLQFPTLFTSWIWLPIYIEDRYYTGMTRIHVHLIAQRDRPSRKYSTEGSYTIYFEGGKDEGDYFPQVEGTVFEPHINIESKSTEEEFKREIEKKD